jgi:nickel-dependent lactate racemase
MKIEMAYGQSGLTVDLPDQRTTVIEPRDAAGLTDEKKAVMEALANPIEARPLREIAKASDRVCIVFTDITRATPNERIIPWLLECLGHVPRENITLLNSLGTHRKNTPVELDRMLTPEVARNYRVINHEAEKREDLVPFGTMHDGSPALINRHLAKADVRIITGFIEPHFFAGFSGGPKGILPGVAALKTVMSSHDVRNIGNPKATFGMLEGNPLWEEIRDVALRVGPSFLLNVTLNKRHQITGVFAGDLIKAHRVGVEFVRRSAMQPVERPFEVVVTSNSGYPLDLNLYQGVKGMSAGAQILADGGLLILVAECREGVPGGSPFDRLLRSVANVEELRRKIEAPGFSFPEQWQAQIQARIQARAEVHLCSSISDEIVRAVHLKPCRDVGATVRERLKKLGAKARVAVLPQGPLTIPYLRQ